jgi:hypothetical protein
MNTSLDRRIAKLEARKGAPDELVTFGHGDEAVTIMASQIPKMLREVNGKSCGLPNKLAKKDPMGS